MNNAQPFLFIDSVFKTYRDKNGSLIQALDGVSLEIQQGEIFSLLGVNGAGKTTLSSILATQHPPTSGDIWFKGQSIYKNLMEYRAAVGFCPQKQNLDVDLNVHDNLLFAGRYFLMPEHEIRERSDYLMQVLELDRYRTFAVNSLSGGNKQRLLIARALMHKPELVILDEPTVGLDPDIRRKLWALIKSLKSLGITIILTTHYLDEAEQLSDRVCILDKGKIIVLESLANLRMMHNMTSLEELFLKITARTTSEENG